MAQVAVARFAPGWSEPTGAGDGMVIDPMGTVSALLGEQAFEAATAGVSAERVEAARVTNPILAMSRISVFPGSGGLGTPRARTYISGRTYECPALALGLHRVDHVGL